VDEVLPGVYRWETRHPDWTPQDAENGQGWDEIVASYVVDTDDGPVLIDPLVADDGWASLDRVLGDRTPHVLITIFWHTRSTPGVLERYPGATAWIHEPAADLIRERGAWGRSFLPGDHLPGGIEAIEVPRAYEIAYLLHDRRALVAGDVLLGAPDGARLFPPSWLRGDYAAVRAALRRSLLPLPVEHLLLTHGRPVLGGGREAIERALHSPPRAA
jgi:hypothetical protein